jgi:hypothetical protein
MVEHTLVSRKTTNEDKIAICPQLGCEVIKRVKPLKLGFLGFGKYPKCKQHHLPLVYVDERIGEIVDASLACLFDKSGLPPKELLTIVNDKFPKELNSFINSWVYCITIGRGAKIISVYMDTITKSYLKQITKKQLKALKDDKIRVFKAIKKGIDEITLQFERLLKHLRVHSEVIINTKEILSPSVGLRNLLNSWLVNSAKEETKLMKIEEKQDIPLSQVKDYYDRILNLGTCRCILGLQPIEKSNKKRTLSAFDRFSAYFEFWEENLTEKFTKSDLEALLNTPNISITSVISFTEREVEFFIRNKIDISKLKTKWEWVDQHPELVIEFYKDILYAKYNRVPKSKELDEDGYRGFRNALKRNGKTLSQITKLAGFNPYWELKYANMGYDELINFYHRTIIPNYKLKYPDDRESYLKQHLIIKDYRGFIDRLYKLARSTG